MALAQRAQIPRGQVPPVRIPRVQIPRVQISRVQIFGVDFTSAPRRAKPITVARGRLVRGAFVLERIDGLEDFAAFERLLVEPGPWIGGFDFPFGLPREAIRDLGWPEAWATLIRHCASLGKPTFKAVLDAYRESRPAGQRYAHRQTDRLAGSSSSLKLVNPPVGLMFLEGAPRLLAAGVSLPGLHAGDAARIAVEAYPGLLARTITRTSYKSDEAAKQTPARRQERARIVAALMHGDSPLEICLEGQSGLLRSLVGEASGDRLDAVLAAMQAAWAWRRRDASFGMPRQVDPCEGWIVGAGG
jgi:hypothetical protein